MTIQVLGAVIQKRKRECHEGQGRVLHRMRTHVKNDVNHRQLPHHVF